MCSTVELDVLMLSWFDLLLLCTGHTHIHRDYWHKDEILERGYFVPLMLYCFCTAAYCVCGCYAQRLLFPKKIHRSS